MARVIEVTPEELESTATQIESLAAEYKSQYEMFYKTTGDMATTWSGKDNLAFINQIDGFKDDFTKMYTLMNNYVAFLRNSAKTYRDTQDTVTTNAQRLVN